MRFFLQFLKPLFSILLGLSLGYLLTFFAGESPWHVLQIFLNSAFGSRYDLGMTLFYATPLIFTGLSVALVSHSGVFNIGAEGQLILGALAAAIVGVLFPDVLWPWAPILATLAAFIAGMLYGFSIGWLRVKRGSQEVITAMMLNFIAVAFSSWVVLYLFKNPQSQSPETGLIGNAYRISQISFFSGSPVSIAFIFALILTFFFWIFLWKTSLGYEIRAVGQNEFAARTAGIDVGKVRMLSIALGGGLAGLVAVSEVLGNSGRFKIGFSPGYGFIGIPVALLGKNRPIGIVLSALLFGALQKGASDLDMETETITRDFALILQGLVILCVSAENIWTKLAKKILLLFKKQRVFCLRIKELW